MLQMHKPMKYITLQTDVSSNVSVKHSEEKYEHRITLLHPEIYILNCNCLTSTSRIYNGSSIIAQEEHQGTFMEEMKLVEMKIPHDATTVLTINAEKPAVNFTHLVRIVQLDEAKIVLLRRQQRFLRSEEVMQTADIQLIEMQQKDSRIESTVNINILVAIENPQRVAFYEVLCVYNERVSYTNEFLLNC